MRRSEAAGCCVLLGIAQYLLYSVNFHQFFQGDAIYWMYFRFRSVGEFLRGLYTLDIAHWYRPLSNRTIPSLLYPLLGLRPYGYHLVFFACFFATTCVVFLFLRYLTGKTAAGFLGAFYFSIHSIDFYTTYDFAFAPEVFYVLFYVLALWIFIEGERRQLKAWRTVSVLCFALSLMSKEAASTFPAMLVLAYLVFVGGGLWRALRASVAHLGVWVFYLVYIVGYLKVGGGDYMLVASRNVLENLATGFFYAFNLRRDGFVPTRIAPSFVFAFLVAFAVVQILLGFWLLLGKERRLVLFGALWFVIGLAPMLMLNGLGPYYVFLALIGFSLIVGSSWGGIYEKLSAHSRWGARTAMAVLLAMFWISCRATISADTASDTALGYASMWAKNSAYDMLGARPRLAPGSNIYILNESTPDLWRFHGIGGLSKLVYEDDSISTSFRSIGQSPKAEGGELVVMKTEGEHLVDVTAEYRQNPQQFLGIEDESRIQYVDRPGVVLGVAPVEVVAGRDFYWLSVSSLGSDDLVLQYTVNDGPVAEGRFRLNPEGKVRFFVSAITTPGVFRFVRFRAFSSPPTEWIRGGATLRVLPPQH